MLSFNIPHNVCQVGVKLPNGTTLMPIPKRYLHRAMGEFFQFHGISRIDRMSYCFIEIVVNYQNSLLLLQALL